MYTLDLLEHAHRMALKSTKGLPLLGWYIPATYGDWSVKDVFAHFTSCEYVLLDIMAAVMGSRPTPTLARWLEDRDLFDQVEIARRHNKTVQAILNEYNEAHAETIYQIIHISDEKLRENGTLPWYGEECDLEQFITYTFYHHKRELAEYVAGFRDQMLRVMSREKVRRPDR